VKESRCPMQHKRRGIVTTHPDRLPTVSEGHFAASCCGNPDCIRELAGEAYKVAGILGVYRADPIKSSASRVPADSLEAS
jgi:hypothetical protein